MTIVRLLHTVEPYDWPLTLRMIGAHTVPGTEEPRPRRGNVRPAGADHRRVRSRSNCARTAGRACWSTMPDAAVAEEVVAGLRHWLDLDHDPATLSPLRADPVRGAAAGSPTGHPAGRLSAGVRGGAVDHPRPAGVPGRRPNLRRPAGRLATASPGPAVCGGSRAPTGWPSTSAADLQSVVGVTGARARSLLATARAFADDPRSGRTGPAVGRPARRTAPRIWRRSPASGRGPWRTCGCACSAIGMRFPAGDLVLRRALGGIPAVEVTRMAERWRPWRSYAVFCPLGGGRVRLSPRLLFRADVRPAAGGTRDLPSRASTSPKIWQSSGGGA